MVEKAAELWYYKQIGAWIVLSLVVVAYFIWVVVCIWDNWKKGR